MITITDHTTATHAQPAAAASERGDRRGRHDERAEAQDRLGAGLRVQRRVDRRVGVELGRRDDGRAHWCTAAARHGVNDARRGGARRPIGPKKCLNVGAGRAVVAVEGHRDDARDPLP